MATGFVLIEVEKSVGRKKMLICQDGFLNCIPIFASLSQNTNSFQFRIGEYK